MISIFLNDLMYGCVISVPHPSANNFNYTIEWEMLRLPYGFPIAQYLLCASVSNTNTLKLHLQLDINRDNIGKYSFT